MLENPPDENAAEVSGTLWVAPTAVRKGHPAGNAAKNVVQL